MFQSGVTKLIEILIEIQCVYWELNKPIRKILKLKVID